MDEVKKAATYANNIKNKDGVWSLTEVLNLSDNEILDLSRSLKDKDTAKGILTNFQPMLWAKEDGFDATSKQRNINIISMAFLPTDFYEWILLTVFGDGNCLYNSVFIALQVFCVC